MEEFDWFINWNIFQQITLTPPLERAQRKLGDLQDFMGNLTYIRGMSHGICYGYSIPVWIYHAWLCASDFNEILRSSEKECGSSWSQAQMQIYREAIDKCGFLDLGFTGSQFTWQKHFVAGHSVWEMLDHGFVTNDWLLQFVESKVHHLSCNTSDHSPLWMVPRNWKIFVSLNHSTLKKCGSLTEDVLKQWKPCCLVLTMMVQLFG